MFLRLEQLPDYISGIIHEETQFSEKSVDLTVERVFEVTSPTEFDFGGSEKTRRTRGVIP